MKTSTQLSVHLTARSVLEEQLIIFSLPINCTPEGSKWRNQVKFCNRPAEHANEGRKMDAHLDTSHSVFLLIHSRRSVKQHHLFLTAHCAAFTILQLDRNNYMTTIDCQKWCHFAWVNYFDSSYEKSLEGHRSM